MSEVMQDMARQISHGLIVELGSQRVQGRIAADSMIDLLLQQLAVEVVRQLRQEDAGTDSSAKRLEGRLRRIERRLERLAIADAEEDEDDDDEMVRTGASVPSLKHASPKYQDLESVLKYVDSDDDRGGVKLVIMNFND